MSSFKFLFCLKPLRGFLYYLFPGRCWSLKFLNKTLEWNMSNLIKKLESELKNSKLFLDLNPLKALWFIPAEFAKSPCSERELTKRNLSRNYPFLKSNHWKKYYKEELIFKVKIICAYSFSKKIEKWSSKLYLIWWASGTQPCSNLDFSENGS